MSLKKLVSYSVDIKQVELPLLKEINVIAQQQEKHICVDLVIHTDE
jgi:hypothetical protein